MSKDKNTNAPKPLEPSDFDGIKSADDLRRFENMNRDRILSADDSLQWMFNDKWKSVVGQGYFVPSTVLPPAASAGYMAPGQQAQLYPKGQNYHYDRRLKSILWERYVEKRRSNRTNVLYTYEHYHLVGVLPDNSRTTIEFHLDKDQMARRLGEDPSSRILAAKGDKGSLDVDIVVPVVGYWEVMFSPKSNPNDTDDVVISWEEVCLQIRRGLRVVLHGYFLEVCDNGTYPRYIQTPQESRKITAWVQFYPYTVTREASEVEFLLTKEKGDIATKEERRRQEEASLTGQGTPAQFGMPMH